jgi:hypothetical protein
LETNKKEYKVKWKKYKDCIWEPIESVQGGEKEIIEEFKE